MAAMIEKLEPGAEEAGKSPGLTGEALRQRLADHFDVVKRPNDIVRITKVTGHHFRVNTLTPRMADHEVLSTYHIVKSQFLHVEEKGGELVITDQTRH